MISSFEKRSIFFDAGHYNSEDVMSSMTNDVLEISLYALEAMLGRPPTNEAPPFGKKITALRKKHGLTQIELAEQLGVSQQTVAKYERRTTNPSLKLVQRLASFFDVEVVELFGDQVDSTQETVRSTQLERAFISARELPRKKQKVIAEIMETFVRANT
ncbi:MAG: helix-turn-helix transcriptional regulator [Deltaproteobacteria bacterium]|nr:helix-turn-helix transcriptional regulator [Deltaproteobacteria bacterium]